MNWMRAIVLRLSNLSWFQVRKKHFRDCILDFIETIWNWTMWWMHTEWLLSELFIALQIIYWKLKFATGTNEKKAQIEKR